MNNKRNKGFIATSLIFTFFLIFVAIITTTIGIYSYYRGVITRMNGGILEDLNDKISQKYVKLQNYFPQGNFESLNVAGTESYSIVDSLTNVITMDNGIFNEPSYSISKSLRMNDGRNTDSLFTYNIVTQNTNSLNHTYYVRAKVYKNRLVSFTRNCSFKINTTSVNICDFNDNDVLSWKTKSFMISTSANNFDLIIDVPNSTQLSKNNYEYVGENLKEVSNNIYVDDVMVVDVTELKTKLQISDSDLKVRLDGDNCNNDKCLLEKLEFFENFYSYPIE